MPPRPETAIRWESAERPTIAALITSFNEERHIAACIESLLWCDSILVVDSYSTDRTVEIANGFDKVTVLEHHYDYGAAAQKNWAIGRLEGDWVLILDSDERCLPELREEIQALLLEGPSHNAYQILRRMYFLGRRIRFSGWQNDKVTRLFRKGTARHENRRVHARLLIEGSAPLLDNPMDHYMVDSVAQHARRVTIYSYWGAAQAYREGKRIGVPGLLVRPLYRFIRMYFLQLGFLDGVYGLMFTLMQAAGSFHSAVSLWGWRRNEARGIPPTDLPEFEDGFERSVASGALDQAAVTDTEGGEQAP